MNRYGRIVHSSSGLQKGVCKANCKNGSCDCAHPNAAGSTVIHPKWCLEGTVKSCKKETCVFNHIKTLRQFVHYRMNDLKWRTVNAELVEKYTDANGEKVIPGKRPKIYLADFLRSH